MKKKLSLFLLAGLIWLNCFGTACQFATESSQENASQESTTITVWAWDETFNIKAINHAAEKYKQTHPNVEFVIETREKEEVLSTTKMMLSAKLYDKLPDIILMEDYDSQEVLMTYTDEFADLTELIDYNEFVEYKTQHVMHDGRYYGIPFDCGTAAMFYRTDIIQQAGFTDADMQDITWDEFIEIGKVVLEKTGKPMITLDPTDLPVLRVIMQSCGKWYVDNDGTTATIENNVALQSGLEIYQTLLDTGVGTSENGWNAFISAFQTGDVCAVVSGGWVISSIKENESQSGLWRVARIPVVADNANCVSASNVGGSAWYILNNSANSQIAKEFMIELFVEDSDFQNELISEIGIIPAVADLSNFSNYTSEDPFFGGQQVTKFLSDISAEVPTVNYGAKTYSIEEIIEAEFQSALSGENMEGVLRRAQTKAEVIAKE